MRKFLKKSNMNISKKIACLLIGASFLINLNSCVVYKKDNGKHKGWYKNKKNPHHPRHTKKVIVVKEKPHGKPAKKGKK